MEKRFTHYIVSQGPFMGYVQSAYDPVADEVWLSGGMTLAAYCEDRGENFAVIDDDRLTELHNAHEEAQITQPIAISVEDWDRALGDLPPQRWVTHRGVEMFHMQEHQSGSLVDWFCRIGPGYCRFVDRCNASREHIAMKAAQHTHRDRPHYLDRIAKEQAAYYGLTVEQHSRLLEDVIDGDQGEGADKSN